MCAGASWVATELGQQDDLQTSSVQDDNHISGADDCVSMSKAAINDILTALMISHRVPVPRRRSDKAVHYALYCADLTWRRARVEAMQHERASIKVLEVESLKMEGASGGTQREVC